MSCSITLQSDLLKHGLSVNLELVSPSDLSVSSPTPLGVQSCVVTLFYSMVSGDLNIHPLVCTASAVTY